MSVNKHRPHVYVLPEDDADRQVANGFLLEPTLLNNRIRVLEEAGGWNEVIERFCSIYATEMDRYPERRMILIIDFDGRLDRCDQARKRIPEHLLERVFILGAFNEPEDLRKELGSSYEKIGSAMARDCHDGTELIWRHPQLRHNSAEIERLRIDVRPILFLPA
jgi:hypothetical protein